MIPHISSTRSPQAIFARSRTLGAEATLPAEPVRSISIMPCTAKKDEAARELLKHGGEQDVDLVLTVQEFAAMLDRRGIDLMSLVPARFSSPFAGEVRAPRMTLRDDGRRDGGRAQDGFGACGRA